jgi:phosphoribosylformylglycinamidine (FGAM) synthase-like enzyme
LIKVRRLRVYYGKKLVCDLEMEFLHHGLPQRTMKATKPEVKVQKTFNPKLLKTQSDWLKF